MLAALRPYAITVLVLWAILGTAGFLYANQQSIPGSVAAPLILAILLEVALYAFTGFDKLRHEVEARCPPRRLALVLGLSAVLPYVLYSVPSGVFQMRSAAALLLLASLASFWFVLIPRGKAADLLFIAVMASAVLARLFPMLYADSFPKAQAAVLGQLMWIRVGLVAVLSLRHVEGVGFGFLPTAREWRIGVVIWIFLMILLVPLTLVSGYIHFHANSVSVWKTAGLAVATFLGMLWVVALSEEFFFRGLLQQWMSEWTAIPHFGLIFASLLFGAAHLPFRGFPNWRFALLAALAGFAYGRAFQIAGSVRAAMVAHALTATTWRIFFS